MLFERHWGGAWRLARTVSGRRDMADDIVQDAFELALLVQPGLRTDTTTVPAQITGLTASLPRDGAWLWP